MTLLEEDQDTLRTQIFNFGLKQLQRDLTERLRQLNALIGDVVQSKLINYIAYSISNDFYKVGQIKKWWIVYYQFLYDKFFININRITNNHYKKFFDTILLGLSNF